MIHVLELASSKVTCASFDLKNGKVDMRAFSSTPCRGITRGTVTDLDETARAISEVVRNVGARVEVKPTDLIVNFSGSSLEGLNTQGLFPIFPPNRTISRDDVLQVINHSRQLVLSADREQIQAIPREFRVDGARGVGKPVGMSASRLEVVTHLMIGSTNERRNIDRVLEMAGLTATEYVPQPLASALGVVDEESMKNGVVVIDLGAETTTLAVFHQGAIAFSTIIPVGGRHVTNDIGKLLKTGPEEAERLKIEYGACLSDRLGEDSVEVYQVGQTRARHLQRKVLCEIIESRVREILILARQQIERSGLKGLLGSGVIFTGGASQIPGLPQFAEETLGESPARVVTPTLSGTVSREAANPRYAGIVGLAAFVLGQDQDELEPVSGAQDWRSKIRSLKVLFGPKGQ